MTIKSIVGVGICCLFLSACSENNAEQQSSGKVYKSILPEGRADIYTKVKLGTDLSLLSDESKQILPLLIEAAAIMDEIFWIESYGNKDSLLPFISDEKAKTFATVNYGPWDRLDGNKPFIEGIGEKPAGANFYPIDMTKEEFEAWVNPHKLNQYTLVRRDENGKLKVEWYHEAFADQVNRAADLLDKAAALSVSNKEFAYYLTIRAEALRHDRYKPSDIAWLKLTDNELDIIIGPIENYEDQLFGAKTAHEAYVLVKDKEWSEKLARYSALLPDLQAGLPVSDTYKKDPVGSNAQLNAYDVVFYAGDCNSGSKTIAVNLPNDEELQMEYGTRRSQLKNAMRAKYDKILVPLANVLIAEDQRQHITFDAFFGNTMFHEVAHGLGIKNTVNGKGLVREALKEQASALEEGKADILGLYMVTKLYEMGEIKEGVVMDNYVTFLAGIFRSVRFGASSAHGKANMLRFNYFAEKGAFSRDAASGTYRVNFVAMQNAMNGLSALILELQGNGDYDGVVKLMEEKGQISPELQSDLDRLGSAGIPVDVIFEQGVEVLGLKPNS
jgi:hypothetical protein